jgi:hypothetical protein
MPSRSTYVRISYALNVTVLLAVIPVTSTQAQAVVAVPPDTAVAAALRQLAARASGTHGTIDSAMAIALARALRAGAPIPAEIDGILRRFVANYAILRAGQSPDSQSRLGSEEHLSFSWNRAARPTIDTSLLAACRAPAANDTITISQRSSFYISRAVDSLCADLLAIPPHVAARMVVRDRDSLADIPLASVDPAHVLVATVAEECGRMRNLLSSPLPRAADGFISTTVVHDVNRRLVNICVALAGMRGTEPDTVRVIRAPRGPLVRPPGDDITLNMRAVLLALLYQALVVNPPPGRVDTVICYVTVRMPWLPVQHAMVRYGAFLLADNGNMVGTGMIASVGPVIGMVSGRYRAQPDQGVIEVGAGTHVVDIPLLATLSLNVQTHLAAGGLFVVPFHRGRLILGLGLDGRRGWMVAVGMRANGPVRAPTGSESTSGVRGMWLQ